MISHGGALEDVDMLVEAHVLSDGEVADYTKE